MNGRDLTFHGYESVRIIHVFLDANSGATETFAKDYRLLARLYPLINTDKRIAKYQDGFARRILRLWSDRPLRIGYPWRIPCMAILVAVTAR